MWVDVRNNLKRYGITMETDPANTDSGTPAQPLQLCVPHHARYLEHRNVLRQWLLDPTTQYVGMRLPLCDRRPAKYAGYQ
ncbi:unnamed protein product [Peronospora belbahrii]|uniref:Uncharacterized protein n=1 Tax=Peronospora belbahrii TaxID=622444 RepID=A0AAU9L0U5_9STRA|nr:unnamed protein product [Peronospora belbahrii]